MDETHENIYSFYNKNLDFGFCVRRSSWAKTTFAKVVYIEGVIPGNEMPGKPPYYYNPQVYAVLYMANKEPQAIGLTTPGGYDYELVDCLEYKPKEIKSGYTYRGIKYTPQK